MSRADDRIWAILSALAASGSSPFLFGDEAVHDCKGPANPYGEVILVAEDDHLPSRNSVLRSRLFCYAGVVIAHLNARALGAAPDFRREPVERQGFPRDILETREPGVGFQLLCAHARRHLAELRQDACLRLLENICTSRSDDRLLIRLAPLELGMHARLGRMVEERRLRLAVGIDTAHADLSDRHLYRHIATAARESANSDEPFRCEGDVRVTRLLGLGQRTGLFRRFRRPEPRNPNYAVASCYARLDEELAPARLDLIGSPETLRGQASDLTGLLSSLPKIPPRDSVLIEGLGAEVAVPEFGRVLLHEIIASRRSSSVDCFYKKRGVHVPG